MPTGVRCRWEASAEWGDLSEFGFVGLNGLMD